MEIQAHGENLEKHCQLKDIPEIDKLVVILSTLNSVEVQTVRDHEQIFFLCDVMKICI